MKDNTSLARLTEEGLKIQAIMELESLNPELLRTELDHIEAQWLTKVENIGHLIQDMDSTEETLEAEIKRLKARKDGLGTRKEWLKGYLLSNMLLKNEPKLKFPLVTVSIANNPPSIEIVDVEAVPSYYQETRTEIFYKKQQMIDNFKKTGEIPAGCRVITDRKHLVVR